MKIFYSELCLINEDLFLNIQRLKNAGAHRVELMLDGEPWDGFEDKMDLLAEELMGLDVQYAVHSPVWNVNLTAGNQRIRKAAMASYKDSILFAKKIGASHVVLHPGFRDIPFESRETARKRAKAAIRELAEFNADYGVPLLVENVGNADSSVFTMEEYMAFFEDLPESVRSIIDIGHANITGWDVTELIARLGARIQAFHVNDNDGVQDIHMAIYEGNVDWNPIFQAMKRSGHEYDLILEYNVRTDLEKLREGKRILEEALDFTD